MLNSPRLSTLSGYWNGKFQRGETQNYFEVYNPATHEKLATLPEMGAQEAEAAVDSAEAFLAGDYDLEWRKKWLLEIAAALSTHRVEMGQIITLENGKPPVEALAEVDYAAAFYRDAAQRIHHLAPQTLPTRPRNMTWRIYHRPAGVAALITPWNFPLAMLAKKLSGAIAAGCPSVVKPSELTPLTAIAFFALLDELGLPAGLVNLVFGDAPAIGQVLCARPSVQVISFTGSTAVGRLLAAQAAPQLKRLSLELGGNAPFILFEDGDIDHAVGQLMANKFRCAGQTCVCSNRILVQANALDAFLQRLKSSVSQLRWGPGLDDYDIGPMINAAGFEKVQRHIQDALDKGAELIVGGPIADASKGHYCQPTVVLGGADDMLCLHEETFGPLIVVRAFDDEAEALRLANDTEYGLAAYLFSQDSARLERVARQLHFGHVGLNTATGPTPEAPFGGMRNSGLGREGGLEGLMEFIEVQTCPVGEP